MSSFMSNDDNCMNYRIPRKKTASSLPNNGSKYTTGIHSTTTVSTANQPTAATDTLSSIRIPRKSKDGAPSNNKKRTHDMSSSIATTTKKKVKTTATPRDNSNNTPLLTNNVPTYQIVKEGRVSGYPIIVSQVGSEHDAILLGCKANPQEYLNNNKDGTVKIRWKFAGYNGLVPTTTVRLKLVDGAPPIRKAAVLSGLLETGNELALNKDVGVDLGGEEDDDIPILKAIRTELSDNTSRADKDGDYNDQEDRDEKLVCYERSASVGYQGGKTGTAAPPDNGSGIRLSTNQDGADNEEDRAPANQNSDNAESSFTDFDPQVNEADTNPHKPTPPVVTSQSGIKAENDDTDSVATDPMTNEEVVPMEVKSDMNVKTEGEETDDDELTPPVSDTDTNSHKPTPPVVTSKAGIKSEDTYGDCMATDPMVNADALSLLAAYGNDTDDDELKPSAVASDMNIKREGEDTDDELELQPVASNYKVKRKVETAYECDTDDDELKPLVVKSDMNVKAEEVDTDDEMDAQQQVDRVSSSNVLKKEKDSAYGYDTDNDEPKQTDGDDLKPSDKLLNRLCYKEEHPFEKRKAEAERVRAKYPERIPIICEKVDISDIPDIDKRQYLVPATLTVNQFQEVIKKRLGLVPEKAMYLFCSNTTLPNAAIMLDMYEDQKDEDGYLYIQYSGEPHKPSQEDTDDEMNTSSLNHDDLIPTISASTSESEEDTAVVLDFFKKLCSCLSSSMTHLEEMIKANPYLLEAECTHKIPGVIHKGYTAMEAVCQQGIGAATRDLLYELVLLGGKATDKCYEELDRKYNVPFDHLAVLLLSGYYPTKGDFLFLDQLANVFLEEIENEDSEVDPVEMLSIIYKIVKLGDNLSCGNVDSIIMNNINQLPTLEAGVTHSKGGPMEELLKQYPMEKVEQKKKEVEEGEKSPNPEHEEMPIKSVFKWTPPDHSSRVSNTEQEMGKHEEVSNNKSTAARTCSACKLAKSTKDFSKNQRGKGAAAKCKDCIATMQQRIQEAQEIKKQKAREKSELLATENKMMEALDERQCAKCRITKKKEAFDLVQLRKGKSAECEDCVAERAAKQAERQRIAMEEEKKRRKIRIQPIIEENEKIENIEYKQTKERFEQYTKKLEEEGRSIEEEMNSTSNFIYIVTSANRGMDPFSPHLHGIYTTCKGAQESARRAFAEVSSTYRGGKFLPDDERIAKCDISEFLIPGIKCNSRIMFELFGEGECVDYRSVAVTAVPIDQAESMAYRPEIPCLRASYEPLIPLEVVKIQAANSHLIKGIKVYAIFSRQAEYIDGGRVTLDGVYTNKEDAIARNLNEKQQKDLPSEVSSGSLFYEDDSEWEAVMNMVALDQYENDEVKFRYGCWLCPEVEGYD